MVGRLIFVRNAKNKMIIFVYGEDSYRSRQKLSEIIEQYKKIHKSGLNLKSFDGKMSYNDLKDGASNISMFKEKKLIVLNNISLNKKFQEDFLENPDYLKNSEDIFLFYEEGDLPKSKFCDSLKKIGKCQEFTLLKGQKLENWLKKEFKKYGFDISEDVVFKMIDFTGGDLWQLANEIKKITTFKNKEKTVSLKDIELLVKPNIENDIFKTIDAIAQKNKSQAITLLHRHLRQGDNPLYLLTMINFQFRNLLMMKSEDSTNMFFLAKKLAMNPYVVRKTMQQVGRFSLAELKKIYRYIFQIDSGVKTGKINTETALDLFLSKIG